MGELHAITQAAEVSQGGPCAHISQELSAILDVIQQLLIQEMDQKPLYVCFIHQQIATKVCMGDGNLSANTHKSKTCKCVM